MPFDPSKPTTIIYSPPGSENFDPSRPYPVIEEPDGLLMQARDIPVSIGSGVITGLKGLTDIFGADNPASQTLADYQQFYQDSLSNVAKADQIAAAQIMKQAEGQGITAEMLAGLKAFTVNPVDQAANMMGTMAPIIATGVAGRAVGLGGKAVQALQVGVGGAQGAGIIKGDIYDATKQYLLDSGIDPVKAEEAAVKAQEYGGENLGSILAGAGLGAVASGIGIESIINKVASKGGKFAGSRLAGLAKGAVTEGVPEGAQGGQERWAQNQAMIHQGAQIDPMAGVVSQATLEGAAGAVMGAPVGFSGSGEAAMPVRGPGVVAPAEPLVPAVDPAVVASEFGDSVPPATQEQAAQAVEQPQGPPITVEATRPAIAVDNRTQSDTSASDEQSNIAQGNTGLRRQEAEIAGRSGVELSPIRGGRGQLPGNTVANGEATGGGNGGVDNAADGNAATMTDETAEILRDVIALRKSQGMPVSPEQEQRLAAYDAKKAGVDVESDQVVSKFVVGNPLVESPHVELNNLIPIKISAGGSLDNKFKAAQEVRDNAQKYIGGYLYAEQNAKTAAQKKKFAKQYNKSEFNRQQEILGYLNDEVLPELDRLDKLTKQRGQVTGQVGGQVAQPPQPVAGEAVDIPQEAQDLKAKLAAVDPMFASEDYWKAFAADGYTPDKIEKMRGMLANFSKPKAKAPAKGKTSAAPAGPIAAAIDRFEGSGEIQTVNDLANELEAVAAETNNAELEAAVRQYRTDREAHVRDYGMRDDDGGDAFVAKVKGLVQPNPQLSPASENADSSKNVAATAQPAAAKGDGVLTKSVSPTSASSKLDAFLAKGLQRDIDAAKGQQVLDDMADAGESPLQVVTDFYNNTYDKLPLEVQAKFDKYVKSLGWPIPANMDSSPKAVGLEGASDLPNDVDALQGTERGFVALAKTANTLAVKQIATTQPAAAKGDGVSVDISAQPDTSGGNGTILKPSGVSAQESVAASDGATGSALSARAEAGRRAASGDIEGGGRSSDNGRGGNAAERLAAPQNVFGRDEITVSKPAVSKRKRPNGTDGAARVVVESPSVTDPDKWYRLADSDKLRATVEARVDFDTGKSPDRKTPIWSVYGKGNSVVARGLTYSEAIEAAKDHVMEANGPQSPVASRIRKNLKPNSGAVDLDIINDLVDYGKQFYRAGMTFGKWAGQMVKEFGQAVAKYLRRAYDSIVKAYKESPYSSESGAAGNNPQGGEARRFDAAMRARQGAQEDAKPRRFEERAKASPDLSDETKGEIGSEYQPITINQTMQDAIAWIDDPANGLDAAFNRIVYDVDSGAEMSPLDHAIGIELATRLDAMKQPGRAGVVISIISRKLTTAGQTLNIAKAMAALSPETVESYVRHTVESTAKDVNPALAAELEKARKDLIEAQKQISSLRKQAAEYHILDRKTNDKIKATTPTKKAAAGVRVKLREVLTSDGTRAEVEAGVIKTLMDAGMSEADAKATGAAIVNGVYTALTAQKKRIVKQVEDAHGWRARSHKQLMAKLMDGEITDDAFIDNLTRLAGVPSITPELRTKLLRLTTEFKAATDEDIKLAIAASVFEEAHSVVPPEFWGQVRALSYISMLLYVKTWIKNITGNSFLWVAHIGRDGFVNMADAAVSTVTGKRKSSGLALGERVSALLTPVRDFKKGYEWNKQQYGEDRIKNFKAGLNFVRLLSKLTTQNKWDITDAKEVGRRMFSSRFMRGLEATLSIALGAADRAFWKSALEVSLAQREAAAKINGEWNGVHTPEDLEAAWADAARAIFQDKNVISQAAAGGRGWINWLSTAGQTKQFGLGTALLAFTQVPGSILKRGAFDWSPLGGLNVIYQLLAPTLFKATKGRAGHRFDQRAFSTALSEAMLGSSALFGMGFWLCSMGIISAGADDDQDVAAANKAQGWGAYKVNLSALKRMLMGDMTPQKRQEHDYVVNYDWAQPLAIAVAAGAEMAAQFERDKEKGIKTGVTASAVSSSIVAGIKSLEDQPLVSGLSSFMKTWGYSGPYDAIAKTALSIPSMFVPQAVRAASQYMDNTLRESRGGDGIALRAWNGIAAQTPGISDNFPARMDITGKPIPRSDWAGQSMYADGPGWAAINLMNSLANPFMVSRVKANPALSEVARLMQTTGETSQFPRTADKAVSVNGTQLRLTNEQLTQYQYYLGNYTMAMFTARLRSAGYQRMNDIDRVKVFSQDIEDINAAVKSALFGHDPKRLTKRQRTMRAQLVRSPLGQSAPPTSVPPQ
jgi:hypothetical protein